LNNLAWLLALARHQGEEALQLINRALDVGSASPELRDTRAVIYLTMKQDDRAVQDLDEVVAESPSLAMAYFHRAWARLSKDRRDAARDLAMARKLGLKVERLHALELPPYQQLESALGKTK
jgi:predicted Zn-dependent protease